MPVIQKVTQWFTPHFTSYHICWLWGWKMINKLSDSTFHPFCTHNKLIRDKINKSIKSTKDGMAAHQISVPNRCSFHGNRICGNLAVALGQPKDESTMSVPSHVHLDVSQRVFYSRLFRYVCCRSRWSHATKMRILSRCGMKSAVFLSWVWQDRRTRTTT